MSSESVQKVEPPECSTCGIEMEFQFSGTESGAPLIGTETEYQQFSCPECGQGARFERTDPEEEWERAGL